MTTSRNSSDHLRDINSLMATEELMNSLASLAAEIPVRDIVYLLNVVNFDTAVKQPEYIQDLSSVIKIVTRMLKRDTEAALHRSLTTSGIASSKVDPALDTTARCASVVPLVDAFLDVVEHVSLQGAKTVLASMRFWDKAMDEDAVESAILSLKTLMREDQRRKRTQ